MPVRFDYANQGDFYDVDFNDDGKFVSPRLCSVLFFCREKGDFEPSLSSLDHPFRTARRHHLDLHPHLLPRPPSDFLRLREAFLLNLYRHHPSSRPQGDQEDT